MKKYLSFLLALLMVLSTVSFAAPTMVGVATNPAESDTIPSAKASEEAVLTADENLGMLVYNINFDNYRVGDGNYVTGAGSTLSKYNTISKPSNLPENFPYDISYLEAEGSKITLLTESETNKVAKLVSGGQYPCFKIFAANNNVFPGGKYTLKFDIWTDTDANQQTLDNTSETITGYTSYLSINYSKTVDGKTSSTVLRQDTTASHTPASLASFTTLTKSITGISNEVSGVTAYEKLQIVLGTAGKSSGRLSTKNVFYIDNLKVYYKPEYKADVEFYDYRKGYMDITVPTEYATISAANAKKTFIKSSNFDDHTDVINNEDGTTTYRLYESSFLRGVTVELNTGYESTDCVINLINEGKSHIYNELDMTNYDGENLVANGDLSNPYYTGAIRAHSNADFVISDGAVTFTLKSSATPWNNQSFQSVPFEQAKYFIEAEVQHNSPSDEIPVNATYSVSQYFPFLNNDGSFSFGQKYYSKPNHIPSATSSVDVKLKYEDLTSNNKKTFVNKRMLDLTGDNYPSATKKDTVYTLSQLASSELCFQFCPSGPYAEKINNNNVAPKAAGLSFKVNHLSIKKMFTASFTDGTNTDVLDIAKDVEFTLPTAINDKPVSGWVDADGNKYNPGALYTPKEYVATGITFMAVFEHDPVNQQKTSIRFGDFSGIRFLASVAKTQREKIDEYGFVVTTKAILDSKGLENDALAFDAGFTVVSGACFNKAEGLDKIYEINETDVFFTGVVYGIPENQYNAPLVVRPYTKVGDTYFYGDTTQASVLDVVKKIRDNGYAGVTEEQAQLCKSILFRYGEYLYETEEGYVLLEDNAEYGNIFNLAARNTETLAVTADPTDANNTVYSIESKPTTKQTWTYIQTPKTMKFKENAVYVVTYDIYLNDTDSQGNPVTTTGTQCAFNFATDRGFAYGDTKIYAKTWNNVTLTSKLVYTGTDSNSLLNWYMTETTVADTASGLEVPAGIFGIYTSPNGAQYDDEADGKTKKYACDFYIDNIKLVELK